MRWYDPSRWEITAKLAAMLIGIWIGAALFWMLAWPYDWWPPGSALIGGLGGGLCGVCLGGRRIGALGYWCAVCTAIAMLLGTLPDRAHERIAHERIVLSAATGGLVLGLIGGLIQTEVMSRCKQVTPVPGPVEEVP
jgi:hypothetical protein